MVQVCFCAAAQVHWLKLASEKWAVKGEIFLAVCAQTPACKNSTGSADLLSLIVAPRGGSSDSRLSATSFFFAVAPDK